MSFLCVVDIPCCLCSARSAAIERFDLLCPAATSVSPARALSDEQLRERCEVLVESITVTVFSYVAGWLGLATLKRSVRACVRSFVRRGLFERDKITVAAALAFRVGTTVGGGGDSGIRSKGSGAPQSSGSLNADAVRSFINAQPAVDPGPLGAVSDWLDATAWAMARGLEDAVGWGDRFVTLGEDLQSDADGWQVSAVVVVVVQLRQLQGGFARRRGLKQQSLSWRNFPGNTSRARLWSG